MIEVDAFLEIAYRLTESNVCESQMFKGQVRKDLHGEAADELGLVPVSTKTGRERTRDGEM